MSIVTKRGDQGETGLMFDRRVGKDHPRIEACGALDELSAALGLAYAHLDHRQRREQIREIQQELVILMGEVATRTEDGGAFERAGFRRVRPGMTARLDVWVRRVEETLPAPSGWIYAGANPANAALHLARTICRRAERRVAALRALGEPLNPESLAYLNRLSDLIYLWACAAEEGAVATAAEADAAPLKNAPPAAGSRPD